MSYIGTSASVVFLLNDNALFTDASVWAKLVCRLGLVSPSPPSLKKATQTVDVAPELPPSMASVCRLV